MSSPYDDAIGRLRRSSLPDRPVPPAFAAYLDKVSEHAYRIVDRDIDELRERGYSEDEIFERTVSAAVAAGLGRLEAALRVVT